jgi:phosphoribosylformylglycinamidine cyclo-ligase
VLPRGTEAVVRRGSWTVLPIFQWLERAGGVPAEDMLRTFNMGVGLILVAAPADADRVMAALGGDARVIGAIASSSSSDPHVRYEG